MGFWQKSMIAVACSKPLRAMGEAVGRKTGLSDQFVSAGDGDGHIARALALQANGIRISSFYLGEYVEDIGQVRETVDQLRHVMPGLHQAGLDVHVSIDPSQLGYMQDPEILDENVDLMPVLEPNLLQGHLEQSNVNPIEQMTLTFLTDEDGNVVSGKSDADAEGLDAMILSGRKFLPAITSRQTGPWSGLIRSGPSAGLIRDRTTPFSSTLGLPLLSKREA